MSIGDKILFRHFSMRRERVIQRETCRDREQPHTDQRRKHSRNAYSGGQHRNDFVRAGHPSVREKQSQQERDRQKNDENLRYLGGVILYGQGEAEMFVDESGNVVADIENEPDGEKAGDTVKIHLQKIANDVAVEQSHGLH